MRQSSFANNREIILMQKELDADYIKETLAIYKPEHIYLRSASFRGSEIIGQFHLQHYPFTKDDHIDYVTASMLMLYLSQLGYVLVRVLLEDPSSQFKIDISTDEFFRLRDQGNLMFTRFDQILFKKKLLISDDPLQISMTIHRVVHTTSAIIGDVAFAVGQNFFTGTTRVVLVLGKEAQDD